MVEEFVGLALPAMPEALVAVRLVTLELASKETNAPRAGRQARSRPPLLLPRPDLAASSRDTARLQDKINSPRPRLVRDNRLGGQGLTLLDGIPRLAAA